MTGDSGNKAGSDSGLSDDGAELYDEMERHVKEPLKSTILEDRDFVSGLTEEELLTFICVVFPEYIDYPEVRDRIGRNRVKNAVSMLEKGKITVSRAAEVAGMGYYEFEDHLENSKVK